MEKELGSILDNNSSVETAYRIIRLHHINVHVDNDSKHGNCN